MLSRSKQATVLQNRECFIDWSDELVRRRQAERSDFLDLLLLNVLHLFLESTIFFHYRRRKQVLVLSPKESNSSCPSIYSTLLFHLMVLASYNFFCPCRLAANFPNASRNCKKVKSFIIMIKNILSCWFWFNILISVWLVFTKDEMPNLNGKDTKTSKSEKTDSSNLR